MLAGDLFFSIFIIFFFFRFFFFFNDTATTEIYTLSLHDALPIRRPRPSRFRWPRASSATGQPPRSEEHTSELQSRVELVCRLLLEKKKEKRMPWNGFLTRLSSGRASMRLISLSAPRPMRAR